MGNIIFSITLAVLSFQFFTVTFQLNGINRTLYNVPISIFETSIPLAQNVDTPAMYYDKEILYEKLTSYFDKTLRRYTSTYTVDFYYYVQEDESVCRTDYCDAIEITLKAKVAVVMTYQKSARFYIQKNK